MMEYERIDISEEIDISERIDVDKTDKSKECMLCHYWYFLHKNFSYGPYLCDNSYHFSRKSKDFKNIAIVHIRKEYIQNLFSTYE